MAEAAVWGIHGGKTGDADKLFLRGNCIALGWQWVGDLKGLTPNREAFKASIARAYRLKKPGAIRMDAGQLFRFVHEVRIGDLVAYPSKADRKIHLGRIDGEYHHVVDADVTYPQRRSVKWLCSFPRAQFSQGALNSIGSAMSFFLLTYYSDEFREAAKIRQRQFPSPINLHTPPR